MRRGALVFLPAAFIPMTVASCSLVTSLDDLQNDADVSADASTDVAIVDTSTIDSPLPIPDASPEASTGLLSCSADGLVAYWPMDENTGQTILDCHQGLLGDFGSGTITWGSRSPGKVDLEFSGISFVAFGQQTQLALPGPLTVAGWFRVDALPGDFISLFWNYDGGSLVGFEITMDPQGNTYAQIGFGGSQLQTPFDHVPLGTWVHLAMTFTPGAELRTYFHGVSDNVSTTLNDGGALIYPIAPNDTAARCGGDDGDSSWQGGADDLRIFSRVLSASEISTLASQ
jgi:hypothetical protein